MLPLDPNPTPYDLSWRMFGIPVRVHPSFWLFMAFLGWQYINIGVGYLLLWVVCGFVSILVHELGHVFMGLAFGRPASIVLFALGGFAMGEYHLANRVQRIAIFFAGPGAGLLLYGLAWLTVHYGLPQVDPVTLVEFPALFIGLHMLLFMNLFWSLMNLVPVWPLDGGRISRELFQAALRSGGIRLSLGVSFLVAGGIAVYSVLAMVNSNLPYPPLAPGFMALFFAIFGVMSFQLLQQANQSRSYWDDGSERDPDIWGR